ncbi:MAG: Co2+/Mg2+ efflux protein ApaG [Magnetococcales bacterium]|nr:Co2+/Mg2+ efflux protein ApaG [Magnetococcales bacterium]
MTTKKFNIEVNAVTKYMESRSDPDNDQYAFGYALTISNNGYEPAQLLRRHWFVKSDNGNIQEVQGEGVIGEQPLIKPGGVFKYTSWAMLQTTTGHMEGRFLFVAADGTESWEDVAPFFFEVPGTRVLN